MLLPLTAAACSPPTNSSTSSDGGVAVSTPAGSPVSAPIDVALVDSTGTAGPVSIVPFVSTTVAGDVTFRVKNLGTIEHEMIVLKTDVPYDQIPIADAGDPPAPVKTGANKVDEADNVGE